MRMFWAADVICVIINSNGIRVGPASCERNKIDAHDQAEEPYPQNLQTLIKDSSNLYLEAASRFVDSSSSWELLDDEHVAKSA
ncbi:uncharacterized protein RCO7_00313 [Rhynchosporium graminicola]|uniref:Uncharacterized protein n=1 Tax=Rhynchosporium graminicola TaxID=2792576 RepID=A0A1E1KH28_9HELO|nr:uncharacterized protein RCO7_00313 [Rhynchosporium commune]